MSTDVVIKTLRDALSGEVIVPGDPGYDEARKVWNGVIDRHPAVIARCADVADVVEAVAVARQHHIEVAVRGGGHQVAGSGVCDDGLVIDLSPMAEVTVDPEARVARVGAGARWRDVDQATQRHGLATTGGEISDTGVAGLTLGGGMGHLQRAYGLACDGLRSVEIVTADGVVRTASADEHTDLFWAARGAGRGLGVVTAFEFDLQPLGPEVALAQVMYPFEEAASVVRAWRDAAADAPETISPELLLWSLPADPELPAELHGAPVVIALAVFAGDPADAGPVLAPFTRLGSPLLDLSATAPYTEIQSADDPLLPAGDRYYFKSHFAGELTDAALDRIVASGAARPSPDHLVAVRTLGGAIDRVGPDESAYPHRGASFNVSWDAHWHRPEDDTAMVGWARSSFTDFGPHATGGVYINFAGFDDETDVSAEDILGPAGRLQEVRRAYDPDGVFSAAAQRRYR
jgi:FAD/FMN-containing dehydrogenase